MLALTTALLDNYNRPYRKLKKLKGIIIHWTANEAKGANAIRNRNYFNTKPFIKDANGNKVTASAHYIVDDHSIVQCVPDDEAAFHVGTKNWSSYKPLALEIMNNAAPHTESPNNFLIGIEMCVNADGDFEKTKANTIDLTRHLMQKHNLQISQVHRHYDITGKLCPKMFIDEAKWAAFRNQIAGTAPAIPGTESADPKVVVTADTLNVRTGPGKEYPVARKIDKGVSVPLLEKKDDWIRIGDKEWVYADYVKEGN